MLDNKTYQQELIRMFDSLRETHKGEEGCEGIHCDDCPFRTIKHPCTDPFCVVETYNIVEKWSKEHPKHYYVSQMEYDILCTALDYEFVTFDYWLLGELIEKGYFKGADVGMELEYYFNHCEVVDK